MKMSGFPLAYGRCQKHVLLDMHVPDSDPRFLQNYSPQRAVELCAKSGADAVMVYCNSMVGLAYWPSSVGAVHAGLSGRDAVGETLRLLHDRGLAACAYYSVNFNNWAYEHDPAWQTKFATPVRDWPVERFGICCPNSPGFREFARSQLREIVSQYPFDAVFLDMMFWPGVCLCSNCQSAYRRETGLAIPTVVNWWDPEWCRFQAVRERWLKDQQDYLSGAIKQDFSGPVFRNSAGVFGGWQRGESVALARGNDVMGGDLQAGTGRLFAYGHAMTGLSSGGSQYMHTASDYMSGAAGLRNVGAQLNQAFVAVTMGSQFMAIDGVLPDGRIYEPTYDILAKVFEAIAPYADYLGGRPVADVAVYFSPTANVDFAENGKPLDQCEKRNSGPHVAALEGASAALRRAHLPVTVVTEADLGDLDRYQVLVLPNLLRVSDEEVRAFRAYVERGGHVYASGFTSLVGRDGEFYEDFALAELFGCSFDSIDQSKTVYLRPHSSGAVDAVTPAAYVSLGQTQVNKPFPEGASSFLRVRASEDAEVICEVTYPYGEGQECSRLAGWGSIFTAPPWADTSQPSVVEHSFGRGKAIYSSCDLEASAPLIEGAERLFVQLVRSLMVRPPIFEAETNPNVWAVGFDEPRLGGLRLALLNHEGSGMPQKIQDVRLRFRAPHGKIVSKIMCLDTQKELVVEPDGDGCFRALLPELGHFAMLIIAFS